MDKKVSAVPSITGQSCERIARMMQLTKLFRYDMDFDGVFYSATSFIRNLALSAVECNT